jgi:ABC-type lipopolysaccharide export system ATPase subunit
MNLLTLNATTFTVRQGAIEILGRISPNSAGTTFTFTPVVPLAGNTLYTVTITTGAQNTLGTALASNYS